MTTTTTHRQEVTVTTATITRTETGSQLVAALENVWTAIRERHPEIPAVVIITGSSFKTGRPVWGHYGHDFWTNGRFIVDAEGTVEREHKPELFVAGERLAVGATETVQTMLHEAAHGLAAARGIKDCSRQGRYHNGRFHELAVELGLEYKPERPDSTIGFSAVTITEETRKAYADVIRELTEAIALTVEMPGWLTQLLGGPSGGDGGHHAPRRPRDPSRKSTGLPKAVCGCETPRIIRVARATFELAEITCAECEQPFELLDN
jgi:hypothetical protein